MKDLTIDQAFEKAAQALGVPEAELRAKYGHLSPGLIKMNLTNRVRAKEKKAMVGAGC